MVPPCQFRISGEVTRSVDELEIADEAAADIAKARVVNVGCLEPDTAGVILALFRCGGFKVALEGGEGTTEDVEGDRMFN
jgi:hypothetical protein